ncbi:hypothetical protein [Candidatus Palauibacter sp.]|uniref:hypothetical protein n=1 Tax=Candidatus Palauibacter sp. TaxID=3101350 RepID=UPI003CC54C08
MSERATVWTDEADARLRAYLATPGRHIPTGLGTKDAACSVAAINLALTGELSGDVPGCMSKVIGRWIVVTQDKMPDELRNSEGWRALLPLAAGTGREREAARLRVVMNWMWSVLARAQPVADEHGFGGAWRAMCEQRTKDAARAAARATGPAATAARATARATAKAAAKAAARPPRMPPRRPPRGPPRMPPRMPPVPPPGTPRMPQRVPGPRYGRRSTR